MSISSSIMTAERGRIGFKPPHPGEYLREDILPALGMSATQFATHLGVKKQTISAILKEKRGISIDMAIRLGAALRNGARFWLALQMQHDLWIEERRARDQVAPLVWRDGEAA